MDERRYFEYPEPRVYSKFWRPSLNDTGNMKPGVSQDRILEFWLATRLCAAPATSSFTSVTPPVVKPAKFCARYFVPLRRGDHSNLPVSMNWGGCSRRQESYDRAGRASSHYSRALSQWDRSRKLGALKPRFNYCRRNPVAARLQRQPQPPRWTGSGCD